MRRRKIPAVRARTDRVNADARDHQRCSTPSDELIARLLRRLRTIERNAHQRVRSALLEETLRIPGFDPWIFGRRAEDHAQASAGRFARGLYEAQPCYAPWLHLLIGPTGDVYPCCNLHRRMTPLGNIRDAPLSEIWQDEPLRAFRQQMWAERVADCHRCADFSAENRALHAHLGPR